MARSSPVLNVQRPCSVMAMPSGLMANGLHSECRLPVRTLTQTRRNGKSSRRNRKLFSNTTGILCPGSIHDATMCGILQQLKNVTSVCGLSGKCLTPLLSRLWGRKLIFAASKPYGRGLPLGETILSTARASLGHEQPAMGEASG